MNTTNKKSLGARDKIRPVNRQAGHEHQIKPAAIQRKIAAAQNVNRFLNSPALYSRSQRETVPLKVANGVVNRKPPVYRPQPVPMALRVESTSAQQPSIVEAKRLAVTPPVYDPKGKRIVQPKAISPMRRSPNAPPVYRPAQRKIAQPKMPAATQAHISPKVPPVYCPQPTPKVLQAKQFICQLPSQGQQDRQTAQNPSVQVRVSPAIDAGGRRCRPIAGNGGNQIVSALARVRKVVRPSFSDRPAMSFGRQFKSVQMMQNDNVPKPYSLSKVGDEYLKKFDGTGNEDAKTVARRLTLAQDAIGYARGKLIFGAANIQRQIEDSKGWSSVLASRISEYAGDILGKLGDKWVTSENIKTVTDFNKAEKSEDAKTANRMAANAIVAKWLGAGVCDHFAAVAMFYLEKKAEVDDVIYSISVTTGDNLSHACVIIGDAGLNADTILNSKTAVVADAWPTSPFAVRCLDWKYKSCKVTINLKLQGGSKTNYLKVVRATFKAPYRYGNSEVEVSYRRIGDRTDDGTGYTKMKLDEVRPIKAKAQSEFGKGHSPESLDKWSEKLWSDENSLN